MISPIVGVNYNELSALIIFYVTLRCDSILTQKYIFFCVVMCIEYCIMYWNKYMIFYNFCVNWILRVIILWYLKLLWIFCIVVSSPIAGLIMTTCYSGNDMITFALGIMLIMYLPYRFVFINMISNDLLNALNVMFLKFSVSFRY